MESNIIVIENASGVCKAGFAYDLLPRTVFPAVVGYTPAHNNSSLLNNNNNTNSASPNRRPSTSECSPRTRVRENDECESGVGVEEAAGSSEEELSQYLHSSGACSSVSSSGSGCSGFASLSGSGPQAGLRHAIDGGRVLDWDALESIWYHTLYNELRVNPEEHRILMTVPSTMPHEQIEHMCEVAFETFAPEGLALASQAPLALYSTSHSRSVNSSPGHRRNSRSPSHTSSNNLIRGSGIVLDLGDSGLSASAIVGGKWYRECTESLPVGGRHLTEWLMRALVRKGFPFTTVAYKEIVRDIKERHCGVALGEHAYVSLKGPNRVRGSCVEGYLLPDGKTLTMGKERYLVGECLFDPSLLYGMSPEPSPAARKARRKLGISTLSSFLNGEMLSESKSPDTKSQNGVHLTLSKCIANVRQLGEKNPEIKEECKRAIKTVQLVGGTSLLNGLRERLMLELYKDSSLSEMYISIKSGPDSERRFASWLGGAKLALAQSQTETQGSNSLWLSKAEYFENGSHAALRHSDII